LEARVWEGALYYPYMRIRNENWLKLSALYWDSMRRFKPTSYRLQDSSVGEQFTQAGFLRSLDPRSYAADISNELLAFMIRNKKVLRWKYSIQAALDAPSGPGWGTEGPSGRNRNLGWIHSRKMRDEYRDFLIDEGLGQVGRDSDDRWVGLHPTIAAAYMLTLVGTCADSEGLEPITDYQTPFLPPTMGVESAIRLLTADTNLYQYPGHASDDAVNFAIAGLQIVRPRNLANISVERILDTKNKLGEELATFRTLVARQQPELERLASIQSDDIRAEAFTAHLNSEIRGPLERLERGQRLCGIDTVRSLLAWQTYTPPAVVLGVETVTHLRPVVTAIGTAVTIVGSARLQLTRDRRQQIRESPVGYLLSVKRELGPRTFAERAAQILSFIY
jgi:hypothetical protein